jgi:hypothetical protein
MRAMSYFARLPASAANRVLFRKMFNATTVKMATASTARLCVEKPLKKWMSVAGTSAGTVALASCKVLGFP